jgi:uncharacterized protein YndB with AHSA1/START domain
MSDLGEIHRHGDTVELVFHRHIRRPIEKVWAALTAPERVADWFAQLSYERLEPGAKTTLYFPEVNHRAEGCVIAVEPLRKVAWTWPHPGGGVSTVTFELEPDGDGVRLTLTESGLPADQGAGNGAGWHAHLAGLEAACDGVPTPWSTVIEREQAVNQAYKDLAAA